MNTYLFTTRTTMKLHNSKNWWIDRNIVEPIYISAEHLDNALKEYAKIVNDDYCISISKNALKNKSPMYIDRIDGTTEQVGYVITGKTLFDKGDYSGYTEQYIDLWTDIKVVGNAFN